MRKVHPAATLIALAIMGWGGWFTWYMRDVRWFIPVSVAMFLYIAAFLWLADHNRLPGFVKRNAQAVIPVFMVVFTPLGLFASTSPNAPGNQRVAPAPTASQVEPPPTASDSAGLMMYPPPLPRYDERPDNDIRLTYDVDSALYEIAITRDLIVRESAPHDAVCANRSRESADRQLEDARFIRAHFKPKGRDWTEQERVDYERVRQALALTRLALIRLRACP